MTTTEHNEQVGVERIEASLRANQSTRAIADWQIQYDGNKYSLAKMQYTMIRQIDQMSDREMFFLMSVFSSDTGAMYQRRVEAAQQGFKHTVVLLDVWFAVRDSFREDGYRAEVALLQAALFHVKLRLTSYCLEHGLFTDL